MRDTTSHTHKHAHARTHTHGGMPINTQTWAHNGGYKHTHARTHTHTHTDTHSCTKSTAILSDDTRQERPINLQALEQLGLSHKYLVST